jgi:hypothetical protein
MRGPCESCIHWSEAPGQDPTSLNKTKVCTRNPPQVIMIPIPGRITGQMNISIQAVDPPTTPEHRCGSYESKLLKVT